MLIFPRFFKSVMPLLPKGYPQGIKLCGKKKGDGFFVLRILSPICSLEHEEIMRRVDFLASAIHGAGISDDKVVGIYADVSLHGVFLILAAIKMGLRVAICPLREPSRVLLPWFNDLGISSFISSCHQAFPKDDRWLLVGELLYASGIKEFAIKNRSPNFFSIIRTSGTTAWPKNALINGRAHIASASAVNSYFSLSATSCWALSLPLYHVSGLSILFRCMLASASVYLAAHQEDLLLGLKAGLISHLSLVPIQLERLLDAGADFSAVKAIVIGGDSLPKHLHKRALLADLPIFESYGLTETASMVWVKNCRFEQAGEVLPHAVIEVAEDGEIMVGGSSLFDGYVSPAGLVESPLCEGLFPTGDLAGLSSLGQLQLIIGRKSNRIISGGENIQVEEIERAIEEHPLVEKCVVVGVRDEAFGARPEAYVKWVKDRIADRELITYLHRRLASYKVPRRFYPWPKDAPADAKKPRQWFFSLSSS
jgi:O-succinylbenzoic acid--CoA ligase